MQFSITKLAVAGCLAAALGHAVAADDVITLKMGGFLPMTHYGVVHGAQIFMDEVVARTNGKVKFEYYPAQQMGKLPQMMELAQSGVVDIAEVVPGTVSQKLPLSGIMEMPGLVADACSGAAAMRRMGSPGGTMYQTDFAPNGIRALVYEILPPYSVHTRKPIKSVADFRGMKLRPTGGGMEVSLAKLGAISVKLAGPEIYDSMSKGTVDGVMLTFLAAKEYSLPSVGKYSADGYPFGTGGVYFLMSESKFQSLPKNVQDALVEAGKKTDQHFCEHVQSNEVVALKEARAAGVQVYTFGDKEKAALDKELSTVTVEWAKDLDARGKPATRAVEEFKKALTGK